MLITVPNICFAEPCQALYGEAIFEKRAVLEWSCPDLTSPFGGRSDLEGPLWPVIAIVTITFRSERALGPRVREPDRGKGTRFTSAYNAFNSFADGAAGNGCMPALSESFCRD